MLKSSKKRKLLKASSGGIKETDQAAVGKMAKLTRKKTGIWLIGGTQDHFGCGKLPGRGDVIRVFFDFHTKKNLNVTDSVKNTVAMVLPIWKRAQIPTRAKTHCLKKLRCLHKEWQSLRKNTSRKSETEERKRATFKNSLKDLFDIAHQDTMTMIQREDDRQFLRAQREKGCHGYKAGIDVKQREEKRQFRRAQREKGCHGSMALVDVKQEEEEVKALTGSPAVAEYEERYRESRAVAMEVCPLDMSCDEEASSDSSDKERKPFMYAVKGNNDSTTAHTLAVPVPSLAKGGGQRL